MIYSILDHLEVKEGKGFYRYLKTTKNGSELSKVPEDIIGGVSEKGVRYKKLSKSFVAYFKSLAPGGEYYPVWNPDFVDAFRAVEKKHPQNNRKVMKVSCVYVRQNQSDAKAILGTSVCCCCSWFLFLSSRVSCEDESRGSIIQTYLCLFSSVLLTLTLASQQQREQYFPGIPQHPRSRS